MTQTARDHEHITISAEGGYLCVQDEKIIEKEKYPDEFESGSVLVSCPACHRWIADQ